MINVEKIVQLYGLQNQDLMNQAFYHNEMWHWSGKPVAVQKAKPEMFLSQETKAKLLAIHIVNTGWLRKLHVANR